ncbi:MAG: phosphopantetheine-binding protein, partial [Bacteroidota bacterium]
PGELYIGGIQVARGYCENQQLTEERFNYFSTAIDERLYKTGDWCRWLADGNIEFLGRIDHQVKIRGNRIELGEIERHVEQCEEIEQCVVLSQVLSNDTHLVAYVLSSETEVQQIVRNFLIERLPDYMIPALVIKMDHFPQTLNGKIHRKAFPVPSFDQLLNQNYEAPRSETEKTLVALWQELLQLEQIGLHDNFFQLGGHSILAMQLVSAIRKTFSVELSVLKIFQLPKPLALAEYIDLLLQNETQVSEAVFDLEDL